MHTNNKIQIYNIVGFVIADVAKLVNFVYHFLAGVKIKLKRKLLQVLTNFYTLRLGSHFRIVSTRIDKNRIQEINKNKDKYKYKFQCKNKNKSKNNHYRNTKTNSLIIYLQI